MNVIRLLSTQPWVERLGWTLLHFLWQGALIAGAYAIARNWLGRTRSAGFRYMLACVALLAIVLAPVVTFRLMDESKPVRIGTLATDVSVPSSAADSAVIVSRPFQSLPAVAPTVSRDDILSWLVIVWFAGVTVFWLRLMGGCAIAARMRWMTVRPVPVEWQRAVDRLRAHIGIARPVRLFISALVQVPTLIGWLRPVILLPVGALTGMTPEHIEALLTHELAHVRRHDYLVNVLQGVAEAMLFYHPAVWWVSGHLRAERELCCDDVAVAIVGDTVTYASALAELESQRVESFAPVLAANGGDLPGRIAHLLGESRSAPRSLPGPGLLACAALVMIAACGLFGQAVDTRPSFDVASVKPDKSETGVSHNHTYKGNLIIENVSLKELIGIAYGVEEGRARDYLFSGPDWLDSERFDISAKFPPETSPPDVLLMLQRLLDERFKLTLHRETKDFSVYALVVGKNGMAHGLHPAESPEGISGLSVLAGHASGTSLTMPEIADRLSRPVFQLDHRVVDFTGLAGKFDVTLDWKPESAPGDNQAASASDASIFAAIEEQLGLKLEPRKIPLDVLVVDRANKVPTEN